MFQLMVGLPIASQILSVTCDNASNNDTMVDELERCLPAFSSVNRTRCFTHILNLIAKSILKLFDVKKKKGKEKNSDKGGDGDDSGDNDDEQDEEQEQDDELSDEERELLELAGDIEEEELTIIRENHVDDDEVDDDDDEDGWVDEVAELSAEEQAALGESIRPVSRVLVKVKTQILTLSNAS